HRLQPRRDLQRRGPGVRVRIARRAGRLPDPPGARGRERLHPRSPQRTPPRRLRSLRFVYPGRVTRRLAIAFVAASAVSLPTQPGRAAVKQLDGTVLPQPSPAAEITVVTSRGFDSSADTLAGLFKSFGGGADSQLDPVADATTTSGTFDPRCGLQVSVVLNGGACHHALGWYNATQPATTPTTVYPVVPANLMGTFPAGIGCTVSDFCPLASRTAPPYALAYAWADPLPAFDPQIASNPAWQGGRVGFALVGDAASPSCSQTKYSEGDLGVRATTFNGAWVTALMYPSSVMPGASYLAFEDLPMCASDWKCKGADGDFNDAVFFIAPKPCAVADAGGVVDAGMRDASVVRDASADGAAFRDAAVDRAATAGVAGAAGAGGVPGSGGLS